MLTALEFFAGSGLVRVGLATQFQTIWANDNSPKKQATYLANHGEGEFHLRDVRQVRGHEIPKADLAWASFPCQDLSLAGNLSGMIEGTRSGLFWEWIRLLWELREQDKLPPVLAAENVVGFIVSEQGRHFCDAYFALRDLGYRVGALVIDAEMFLPQSRPRAFIVAVRDGVDLRDHVQPSWSLPFHTPALARTVTSLDDAWLWWFLPTPAPRNLTFSELCEREAACVPAERTGHLLKMLSPLHRKKLEEMCKAHRSFAATAYKRTRPAEDGQKVQRLELRFDGVAGCLRTPNGGSSRQTVILVEEGKVRSRLMTTRECARLMGAPEQYALEGSYNDAYHAMGDAVAVPVTRWLSEHLLAPLVRRVRFPGKPTAFPHNYATLYGVQGTVTETGLNG